MIMISSNYIFHFTSFCVIVSFLNKLPTLGFLFSTAVRELVAAQLVVFGILFLISFILALREVVIAKLVVRGISFLT